ncbi:MAG: hypothetical protein ACYDH4_01955 [Candidatus Cryosericum sp.]
MNKRRLSSLVLSFVGLGMTAVFVAGSVAYLRLRGSSGFTNVLLFSLLMFPASGLAALGAVIGKSRYRRFMYCALALTLCGPITAFLLLAYLQSPADLPWWAPVAYASPIGLIMSCVGAVLVIVESFRRTPIHKNSIEAT